MSSFQDLIHTLHPLLRNVNWHSDLADLIQDYLNHVKFTRITIHKLLSSTTLFVETYLREAVQEYIGATIPPQKNYGLDLLHYAKTKGFIPESKRGDKCIFHLIYWFIEKPRNTTHHSFTYFPLPTILLIICSANYILNEIDHLKQELEFYYARRNIEFKPLSYTLSLSVEDITKDDEKIDPLQLDLYLYTPDKSTLRYPLNKQGDKWNLEIKTHDFSKGTHRVELVGYDQLNNRFNISGTKLVNF